MADNNFKRNDNPFQIIKKSNQSAFVEVLNKAFGIERVIFNFISYDRTKSQGSKITNQIEIYMSFSDFFVLCQDIAKSNTLFIELSTMNSTAAAQSPNNHYPQFKQISIGGQDQNALAMQGRSRPDNMAMSRQMKIAIGNKGMLLVAESGPGEVKNKLIVPRYSKPEQNVMIVLPDKEIKEIFLTTEAHINAYLATKYSRDYFKDLAEYREKLKEKRNDHQQNQNNNPNVNQSNYSSQGNYNSQYSNQSSQMQTTPYNNQSVPTYPSNNNPQFNQSAPVVPPNFTPPLNKPFN